ncbi:hypothetical protein GCM10023093_31430 [Nemorincola caseinilytica]|uniref:T9SS type A sorting domain-containing protein n=2 Tax=Nemorincola caseinilytica TaxID=2054315 RepID=A0ABP8NSJ3_9BACT
MLPRFLAAQCTPGATIRVGTDCTCNACSTVEVMSLETYARTGLNDEWIPSWNVESLKAGSVAYRSYGAYYVANPYNGTYDLANTTCKQVWSAASSSACEAAAGATASEILSTGVGGPIARSEYAAETNGFGCGDGFTGCSTCTPAWPCTGDAVCAGKASAGHWRGMCQWGSQRWALAGQTYTWILDHYYNPGNMYRCSSTSACSPTTGNDFCYGPPAPAVLVPGSMCTPANGTTCGATASIMTSSSSCSNSGVNSNVKDVWYSFTATLPTLNVRVQSGANFDAVVEVYSTVCATATMIGSCMNANGTGQAETIALTTLAAGNTYYIRVYDHAENAYANAPGGATFGICIYDPVTGAVDDVSGTSLDIYPNPSAGTFHINCDKAIEDISISDIVGRKVPFSITGKTGGNILLDLSTQPPGIYYLSAHVNGQPVRRKIVLQ